MTFVDISVIDGKVIVYNIRTPRGMCLNGGKKYVRQ